MPGSFVTRVFLILASSLIWGFAPVAEAVSAGKPNSKQVVVHFDDLNLQNEAGAATLLNRIDAAATNACGGRPFISSMLPRAESQFNACRFAAMQAAIGAIGEPIVAALFERKCRRYRLG